MASGTEVPELKRVSHAYFLIVDYWVVAYSQAAHRLIFTSMNITIIGSGYVGLTTGLSLAYVGHSVTCLDVDAEKIALLNRGQMPFHEPFAAEMLRATKSRLAFTNDEQDALASAEVIYIAVGTPSGHDGTADLKYVRAAADAIGKFMPARYTVVINKSTVPIGSASMVESLVRRSYLKHRVNGQDKSMAEAQLGVASNPEFLREGSALADSLYPDRIVIGTDDPRALTILKKLYKPFLEQTFAPPKFLPRADGTTDVPLVCTSVVSAELIKYSANAFLATKISFANELSLLSEHCGASIEDVARGIGLDHRIGPTFLRAGLGWGGSCFGKDTLALVRTAADYGMELHITQAARTANCRQRAQAVVRLQQELKILQGKTIGVLGLAFKADTDDLRDSPALDAIRSLLDRGVRVQVYDPQAMDRMRREFSDWPLEYCCCAEGVAVNADAVLLATEWSEFRNLRLKMMASKMRTPLFVDGRNFLDPKTVRKAGLRYVGFGR